MSALIGGLNCIHYAPRKISDLGGVDFCHYSPARRSRGRRVQGRLRSRSRKSSKIVHQDRPLFQFDPFEDQVDGTSVLHSSGLSKEPGNQDQATPRTILTQLPSLLRGISGPRAGSNFYEVRDTVLWTHGNHSVRFGGNLALDKDVQESLLDNFGVFSFASSTSARTGNALSDFIMGLPNTMQQDAPNITHMNSWFGGLFLLDDYRIHPRLTLNLGLRWDVQTPSVETNDKVTDFNIGQQSTKIPTAPVGLLVPGDAGVPRGVVPVRWHYFAPRVGFASSRRCALLFL